MTVLLIGLLITGLAIPAITGMLRSLNLNEAGQMVSSQINLAEQLAGSRGYPVEVRLIQSPNSSSAAPYYSAIQLYSFRSGTAIPVNHPVLLPTNAVISGNQGTLSPYLANLQATPPTMTIGGTTFNYVSFRVSAQGLVTPYASFASMYLTVVPISSVGATAAPSNYVTVQVNPATATQLVYRP